MGFFDFFRQPDINQGVTEFRQREGAVLLDVRTPRNTGMDLSPAAKMYLCRPLTK